MDKTVKFTLKIDVTGDKAIKNIAADSDGLKVSMEKVNDTLKETSSSITNLIQNGLAFKTIKDAPKIRNYHPIHD